MEIVKRFVILSKLVFRFSNFVQLISTVIVDPDATNKAILQASIDDKQRLWHHSFHDGGAVRNVDVVEFTDAEFIICPVSITVFNLDDHDWYSVDIARLQEKEWKPKSFDRLVLDQDRKETLIRLAKTNSRLVQATKSKDVIEGKGKGVVLLFHGPPGVGKTVRILYTFIMRNTDLVQVDCRSSIRI